MHLSSNLAECNVGSDRNGIYINGENYGINCENRNGKATNILYAGEYSRAIILEQIKELIGKGKPKIYGFGYGDKSCKYKAISIENNTINLVNAEDKQETIDIESIENIRREIDENSHDVKYTINTDDFLSDICRFVIKIYDVV